MKEETRFIKDYNNMWVEINSDHIDYEVWGKTKEELLSEMFDIQRAILKQEKK